MTEMEKMTEENIKQFNSGAVRSTDADNTRYDLISPIGLRRLAETCAEGAKRYGDYNWLQGFPISDMMNHVLRHLNLYLAGDKTEDHLSHASWGLFAIQHFEETRPDLMDIPTRQPDVDVPGQDERDTEDDVIDISGMTLQFDLADGTQREIYVEDGEMTIHSPLYQSHVPETMGPIEMDFDWAFWEELDYLFDEFDSQCSEELN